MSLHQVSVVSVEVLPHPDPEVTVIGIAKVGGWTVVSGRKQWENHDRGAFIPIDSVIPLEKVKEWDMMDPKNPEKGLFGGPQGNIVKTKKFKGIISQGYLQPVDSSVPLGTNLAEEWGITKYEPPVTFVSGGFSSPWPPGLKHYDIERYENFQDVLIPGEMVVATEKLDGTNVAFDMRWGTVVPRPVLDAQRESIFSACSKNIAFNPFDNRNSSNMYVRVFAAENMSDILLSIADVYKAKHSVTVRGEIIGPGIQGNVYKLKEVEFYAFDIEVDDVPLGYRDYSMSVKTGDLNKAPTLYIVSWDPSEVSRFAYGRSYLNQETLREGAVWRPLEERQDDRVGRVILKTVDPAYLLKH